MKLFDGLKYTLICILIQLVLLFIEIFILKPIIDFFGNGFVNNLIVYVILILVFNPIITYFLSNKLSFISKSEDSHMPLDE